MQLILPSAAAKKNAASHRDESLTSITLVDVVQQVRRQVFITHYN
jgi:hypothetical protein